MNQLPFFSATLLSFIFFFIVSCNQTLESDLLIENGMVYDGLDTLQKDVLVAIKGDKIVYVGDGEGITIKAKRRIDASGLIVAPGFIDPHTHAEKDLHVKERSHNAPFVMQGITTVTVGNDGSSKYPIKKYRGIYEEQGIGTNVIMLVGHGTVRTQVLGRRNKAASPQELEKMKELVHQEMKSGALGLSSGLFYSPGSYGSTEEVIALAKVAALYDGSYDTHLRDESSYNIGLIGAVKEALEIGEKAGIHVHLSHIKCLGVDVWGKSDEVIGLVAEAHERGLSVSACQYPYEASATSLKAATVPRWAEGGGHDSLYIRYNSPLREKILADTRNNIRRRGGAAKLLFIESPEEFLGKNLAEVAQMLKLPPEQAVYVVLKKGLVRVASFNMAMDDLTNFMSQPWVTTGSDGSTGHPRKYGSFPRKYNLYVKEQGVLGLGDFIRRSTSQAASIYKLTKRGALKEGYYADVILFSPEQFRDMATYRSPYSFATGLQYSIINGRVVVEEGVYDKKVLAGMVLTRE